MTTLSPEVIEKWRQEFEASLRSKWQYQKKIVKGKYSSATLENMWQGFLLRCKSAVIELPQDDGTISQNAYVIDAIAHIESQGYQVNFNQPIQG